MKSYNITPSQLSKADAIASRWGGFVDYVDHLYCYVLFLPTQKS